ncbi:MAG: hypothetical protein ACKVJL_04060 [Dehalococcoidia bacterium]
MPSKSKARLNVPEETVGTADGVGITVGTAIGVAVGAGVAVGTEVGVGGTIVAVGNGIGVEVEVAGTGVYRARLSTHPVMASDSKPTSTKDNLATCADRRV